MPAGSTPPSHATAGFDAATTVRLLIRQARLGALATLDEDGFPHASLVQTATLSDGSPLLLLSGLARHTRNLGKDSRASLLVEEHRPGAELQGARVSVKGTLEKIAADSDTLAGARRRFLARHPEAARFADFNDFGFYRLAPLSAHLVAGFGRISEVEAAALLTEVADAADLLAAEAGAVEHMNKDHADAIALYAWHLIGAGPGEWKMIGLDPEGCDLMFGAQVRRLDFPRRVTTAREMREVLVELAGRARGAAVDSPQ